MRSTDRGPRAAELEATVWQLLATSARGRAAAIRMRQLAGHSGVSTRELQHVIKHLVERHGLPIGSATDRPAGYFVIETEEDLRCAVQQLEHRIGSTAVHLARLKACSVPVALQQLALTLQGEENAG